LTGGTGDDVLTGGAGADTVVFHSIAGQGYDTITDFNVGEGDVLWLQRDLFSTIK
jgi:Ca2+-binding RTX toxin-like protein